MTEAMLLTLLGRDPSMKILSDVLGDFLIEEGHHDAANRVRQLLDDELETHDAHWEEMVEDGSEEIERLKALLHDLANNPHICLGDLTYLVREAEGKGWKGPAAKAWSEVSSAVDEEFREKKPDASPQ